MPGIVLFDPNSVIFLLGVCMQHGCQGRCWAPIVGAVAAGRTCAAEGLTASSSDLTGGPGICLSQPCMSATSTGIQLGQPRLHGSGNVCCPARLTCTSVACIPPLFQAPFNSFLLVRCMRPPLHNRDWSRRDQKGPKGGDFLSEK